VPEFTRRVFRANFAEDRDIADLGVITDVLDSMGQAGGDLCERARSAETKDLLRRQTDEAARLGIFGAPSFVVGEELFWGNDRLETAIDWYQGRWT
jgi:2-hydroxychromene-2-carboxylate isomerase